MAFARAVTDQIEAMKKSRKGCPELPRVLPPALFTFSQLEWCQSDCFGLAHLPEFYAYLRKCKFLKIPQEWKQHFPKTLPEEMVGGFPINP